MGSLHLDPVRLLRTTERLERRIAERLGECGLGEVCSEMLSLTGKVAALYGDAFENPEALEAVNDLETLCIGLQRKIWQKIIILESRSRRSPR